MNNPAHPATLTEGFERVTLKAIIASLTNPRRTFTDMAELTDSIRRHGVIQPVLIRPLTAEQAIERGTLAVYELVCGERRFRAAHEAQLDDIPAVIRELTDAQAMELQIIENLQRKDVSEIEEAEGYQAMMNEHGHTVDMLAERVGKSRGYIYMRLKLLDLCPEARAATLKGEISASVAVLLARIPTPSMQLRALKDVKFEASTGEPMSARKAGQYIRSSYMLDMKRCTWPLDDAALIPLAGACEGCSKRTSCNRELFAEITGDYCTDLDCWRAKDLAHLERRLQQHREAGHEVMSQEESLKHLAYGSSERPRNDEKMLVRLDDRSDSDPDKTYAELLAEAQPRLTILQNAAGTLIECISRTALAEALQRAGITRETDDEHEDDELEHNRSQLDDPKNDPYKAEKEAFAEQLKKRREDNQTHTLLHPLLIENITAHFAQGGTAHDDDVRLIARILLVDKIEYNADELLFKICTRHMPDAIVNDKEGEFSFEETAKAAPARIDTLDLATLFALLIDLAMDTHLSCHSPDNSPAIEACATRYGINVAKVRAEATGQPYEEPDSSLEEVAPTPPAAAQAQENSAPEASNAGSTNAWPFAEEQEEASTPPAAAQAQEDKPGKSGRVAAVYRNPDDAGQTWTGRGRKPQWVVSALEAGKTLADLEIKAAQAESKSKGKAAGAAKKPEAKAKESGGKAAGEKAKASAGAKGKAK